MKKVSVTDEAIALWKQVLVEAVDMPEWDASHSSDIKELMAAGLVKVIPGYPQQNVSLSDESMSLECNDKIMVAIIGKVGKTRDEILALAKENGIDQPLEIMKKLTYLDVLAHVQENGVLVFKIR